MKVVLAVALLVLVACGGAAPGVDVIAPESLLSDPPDGVVILDVRTEGEFASGHVPGAVNIPHDQLATRLAELRAEKSAPVVVYCERGGRATRAESLLRDAGYERILHLAGDMQEWRDRGHPTEKP